MGIFDGRERRAPIIGALRDSKGRIRHPKLRVSRCRVGIVELERGHLFLGKSKMIWRRVLTPEEAPADR